MAKTNLPYNVGNNLAQYIVSERGKRTVDSEKNVLLGDIEEELARYCGLTKDGIKAIKNQKSLASLPVALKIAEYFNANVSDLFPLLDSNGNKKPMTIMAKKSLGLRRLKSKCDEPNCDGIHYAKGKCKQHYHEIFIVK